MFRKLRVPHLAKNFRFRLYFIFTVTIALLTAAFACFYVITEVNGFKSTMEREGRLLATVLAQNVRLPLFAENQEALALLAAGTARYPSVLSVTISNADGRALTEVKNPKDTGGGGSRCMSTSPPRGWSPRRKRCCSGLPARSRKRASGACTCAWTPPGPASA